LTPDGFAAFFHERYGSTVVLLITMEASRADAEEIAQETMIAAWQKWESIHNPAAWVRTTAVRKLWKSNRHRPNATPLDETTAQLPVSDQDLAVFSEEQQRVLGLLRQLPPAQRAVAALYYDGLAAEEIAMVTGKPTATVRSHLRHARTNLRRVIASDHSQQALPGP
jgi:RNA polymerase sigma-70 factor (ECF subfamily)